MRTDYVIVGSGLTGAVIARRLADAGCRVVVLERRGHVAGNVADFWHPSGIQVHRYGPHLFRTNSKAIWEFVTRFATFHPYRHQIRSRVDGALENWPIAASYIRRLCGPDWRPANSGGKPANFEQAALQLMPRPIYEKFVKPYTEKQWGVPAESLAAGLCKRFDVREDDNPYLTPNHKHQGIPTEGYSTMVERMLAGIPVMLNFDYLRDRDAFQARRLLVFTGPIDEYFRYELGRLAYRGQRREHRYLAEADWVQPCGQVNNPGEGAHIRQIEWKHMMRPDCARRIRGTVVTRETPWTPDAADACEYPFPSEEYRALYQRYRAMAEEDPGLLICGRLGEYQYYDMDHAIGRAMMLAAQILTQVPQGTRAAA